MQSPIPLTHMQYADHSSCGWPSTTKLGVIVPLYVAMIAGTGGIYANTNITQACSMYQNSIIEVRGNHSKREQVLSIAEHVSIIRDAFGLRMSEVAMIFAVTRPTAYAWLNGSDPKPEVKAKIHRISRLVQDLRDGGIQRLDLYTRRPLRHGRSLIDMLRNGTDIQEAVGAIKATAMQTAQMRNIKGEIGPASRRKTVPLDEISAPIYG
jgi:hypothetical protein